MKQTRQLFEEVAGSGCLAMAGLVPDGGVALVGTGLFLAFKDRFKSADERVINAAVKRVVRRARDELVLFQRPVDDDAWERIEDENAARRVVMEALPAALPERRRIVETAFDVDTLADETIARLGEGTNRLDLDDAEQRAIAEAHVRALLIALKAERDFLAHLSPDLTLEIAADVKAMRAEMATKADLEAFVRQVANEKGVPRAALLNVALKFGADIDAEMSDEDLVALLKRKADEHQALLRSLNHLRNVSPETARLRHRAETPTAAGDYETAHGLLKLARETQNRFRKERDKKRHAEAVQDRTEEVELLTEEAKAAELALDYTAAGDAYLLAVDLLKQDDPDAAAALAFKAADGFDEDARRLGDNGGMERAVALYEARLSLKPKAQDPAGWAGTQNNLGNVLQILGQRSGDEVILQRAVEAYDAALTMRTRDTAPVDWATTQNNLGAVLQVLGERSGDEATLERAVDAYDAALTVYTRDTAPVDWAMTQNNLGNVLQVLGQRRGDEATLQRAVEAYDAALTIYNRDTAPMDWATTENNLGIVLWVLGQRSGDEAMLQRAVDAYDAALTVRTRDAAPVAWAATQNNLGNVLRVLGQRSGDEATLERAVDAYEAALTVRTRDAAPVAWAMTQTNLGIILRVLGQQRGDEATLQRAVEAHEAALAMSEAVGHTAYAQIARGNRDAAQAALDRLRGG